MSIRGTVLGTFLRLGSLVGVLLSLNACAWFGTHERLAVPSDQRAVLVILPARLDTTIATASQVQSVPEDLPDEEDRQWAVAAAQAVRSEARRIFLETIETAEQFRLVPVDEVDRVAQESGIAVDTEPTPAQLTQLRDRLKADLIVQPTVLDYGKVRWYWLAGGMLADMTWETVAIGLASSWNVGIILGNVGFELLTSTPIWFGGGYLFGVGTRPVRVEANAWDPINGESVWDSQEFAVYIWKRLNQVPEAERKKKEVQLYLNLKLAVEELAGSLLDEGLTVAKLDKLRRPPPPPESY